MIDFTGLYIIVGISLAGWIFQLIRDNIRRPSRGDKKVTFRNWFKKQQ